MRRGSGQRGEHGWPLSPRGLLGDGGAPSFFSRSISMSAWSCLPDVGYDRSGSDTWRLWVEDGAGGRPREDTTAMAGRRRRQRGRHAGSDGWRDVMAQWILD